MDWRDIVIRALKTFVEAFLIAVPVSTWTWNLPMPVLKAGVLSAGAAVLAFLWNTVLEWVRTRSSS